MTREQTGQILIIIIGIAAITALFAIDRIPQDTNYHNFSDSREHFGVPNFFNVISNLPFLIVGAMGFLALVKTGKASLNIIQSNKLAYQILYLGTALVGLGSGYYHLNPNNITLVWDRLPMTLAFMGLFSIIISEFYSEKLGKQLLIPLLFAGLASVVYWWYSESNAVGDLRWYLAVQFIPVLTIPVFLFFFPTSNKHSRYYWLLIGAYVLAKLCEHFDAQIHVFFGIISGHSIKHVLPAIGLYILLLAYRKNDNQKIK